MSDIKVGADGTPQPGTPPSAPERKRRTGIGDDDDLLALFKQDMAEELAIDDVEFTHKHRPSYKMKFGTDLNQRQLLAWQRRCIIPGRKAGENIDQMKLCGIILSNLNTGIWRNGERLFDSTGEPLTFRCPEMWNALGADDAVEAVQRFFVRDGYLQAVTESVLTACGFADDVAPDPTDG
jgi:hypothetical protein